MLRFISVTLSVYLCVDYINYYLNNIGIQKIIVFLHTYKVAIINAFLKIAKDLFYLKKNTKPNFFIQALINIKL